MTTHLHHAASTYVLRLLGRQRAHAQRAPSSALDETLAALREGGKNALLEVDLPNGSLGRLLVQVGRLVFVQYENKVAAEALGEIRASTAGAPQGALPSAHLYVLDLSDEQIIFACAALAGIPLALGEALGAGTEPVSVLLTQLGQGHFTGVLALEQGLQTLVWRFQRGRVVNDVRLPERVRAGRFTQLVWQEQLLPEVVTEVVPEVVAEPVADSSYVQTSPQSQSQPPQNAPAGAAQRKTVWSTVLPNMIPKMGSKAAPNAAVKVAAKAALPTPTQATKPNPLPAASQTAASKKVAPQNAVSQPATSRAVTSQPVAAPPAPPSAASQPRPGSGLEQNLPDARTPRRKARPVERDTEEVWTRFQEVVYTQLGSRGERVFELMQGELGGFSRAELIGRLTLQVERIAGSAAARNFRDSF